MVDLILKVFESEETGAQVARVQNAYVVDDFRYVFCKEIVFRANR